MLAPALPPEYYEATEKESKEALLKVLDPAWGTPAGVETAVVWGGAAERVVEYASERRIELIVVATHGRSGLSHALLGSLAESIIRQAPCPVFTIRHSDS
jgi:nucleotide-binding universal stress UspA family protein